MSTLWFILVAFMLTMYVLLDGFDLGAGIIHLLVARTDSERRLNLRAIGPVWDGNEVWLIAAAGTLFFTFPPVWASFWDGIFSFSSALLAFFFGVALGNVIRGVPLNAQGYFFEALWTDFNPFSANPGILDWYTILTGLLAFTTLLTHGANYIAVKTEDPLQGRARRISRIGWLLTIPLAMLASLATFFVQPQVYISFTARPWGIIFPIIAMLGLLGAGFFNVRKRDMAALLSSGLFILGMLATAAFSLYPLVLPAVKQINSLTINNASASQYGLVVGLIWWSVGILLAAIYFIITYRRFWGKVTTASSHEY
jgi:cytochrome bd ubiquinol oxidase subunit II